MLYPQSLKAWFVQVKQNIRISNTQLRGISGARLSNLLMGKWMLNSREEKLEKNMNDL